MGNGREPKSAPSGHLYFAAIHRLCHHVWTEEIEAYPLVNGLPVERGARTLDTKLRALAGVAVGPTGEIFENGLRAVDKMLTWTYVYAAGATGRAPPIRKFQGAYGSMVVDRLGYTYQSMQNTSHEGVAVFSPVARGEAKPVQTIDTPNGALALDARGDLYVDSVENEGRNITVFADPVTSPHMIAEFCWTGAGNYDSYVWLSTAMAPSMSRRSTTNRTQGACWYSRRERTLARLSRFAS
jgi:hypothetical protein